MPEPTHPSSQNLADAVERVAASVIGVGSHRRGFAAACLWQPGVVLTSATAVWRAFKVRLVLPSGESVVGEVRGVDAATDLAVITAEVPGVSAVERRLDAAPRAGDFVFAVGREPSGQVHASFGHVGAAGGGWRTWRGGHVDRLIRLDGGLYPGLQGAPVADASAQVIGVASHALSRLHAVVLPVATVERVTAALLAHGVVARGYLGVAAQPVPLGEPLRSALATHSQTGLLVHGVADDGPAARAGVMVGDIVVAAGGQDVSTVESLRDLLAAEQVGARLRLRVSRGGQPLDLSVDVAARSPSRCH
jgi:S1-C subfamily serine protease